MRKCGRERVLRVDLEALRSQDDRSGSSGTKDAASRAYYQTQCLEVERTTYTLSYVMGRQLRFSLPALRGSILPVGLNWLL
jgi:hypothetical protein